jgi:hypothetical protein
VVDNQKNNIESLKSLVKYGTITVWLKFYRKQCEKIKSNGCENRDNLSLGFDR